MTEIVIYSKEWHMICPNCHVPLVLVREDDKPEQAPSAVCSNCGRSIQGLIWNRKVHIFDLLTTGV